jgi:dihydroorotase
MLLQNCTIALDGKEVRRDVKIENGKIAKIRESIKSEGRAIDIQGKHLLPGIIDPHVHFREPGLTHKEDFYTGSCAAAAGGVTTFLDMPNTKPPTFTVELLNEKRRLAGEKSIVNFGFHFGSSAANNVGEIKKVKNIASVKVYMNATTGNLLIEDEELLNEIFTSSRLVCTHAEEDRLKKAIELCRDCGCGLYVCHVSLEAEIDDIRKAKEDNQEVYAEVTPHHLFLSEEDDKNSLTKIRPVLKPKHDQAALWKAVLDGVVDAVGTDHSPHLLEEKHNKDFPYGFPSIEVRLPLMLDAVNKGRVSLQQVIRLCCHNPADIFRIRNKGFIREGYDADLTVVDMGLVKRVDNEDLLTRPRWTPFNGWKLKGWPVMTIVNGNVVYDNGSIDESRKGKEVVFDG